MICFPELEELNIRTKLDAIDLESTKLDMIDFKSLKNLKKFVGEIYTFLELDCPLLEELESLSFVNYNYQIKVFEKICKLNS